MPMHYSGFFRSLAAAAFVVLSGAPVTAAPDVPKAGDVLFESKHLSNLGKGDEVTYRFQRTVSDEKLLGMPFSDDIKVVVVQAVPENGQRDVTLQVFTGERAREPITETQRTGNPLLVFYLDRAVSNFSLIAGGSRPYLKNRFARSLQEAKVEPVKIAYNGKEVDGYRVTIAPYAGDPNAAKMQGYEGSQFTLLVSEAVPGQLAEMVSSYSSTIAGAPRLEERITLAGVGGAQ
jgi:hypothetical protein